MLLTLTTTHQPATDLGYLLHKHPEKHQGMVVEPLQFVARSKKGLIQPAIKCRGPEYLRIIYGPDYTLPQHLDRFRERGLGLKRGLAVREFALEI